MLCFALGTPGLMYAQNNSFPTTGNVGIGTTSPTTPLEIRKAAESSTGEKLLKLSITDSPVDYFSIENATSANARYIPIVLSRKESDNRFALMISGNIGAGDMDYGNYAVVSFDARLENGKVNQRPLFVWQSYQSQYMTMLANGNLGIGTSDPQAKLAVNGSILATEVKVKTNIAVPDYVFEPDYQLQTLAEIESLREGTQTPAGNPFSCGYPTGWFRPC